MPKTPIQSGGHQRLIAPWRHGDGQAEKGVVGGGDPSGSVWVMPNTITSEDQGRTSSGLTAGGSEHEETIE